MAELVPIRVSELPEVTTAADSDYLVIDNGTQTSRITSENYNATASESAKHYANEALLSAQNAELQAGAASDSADAAENKAQEANASAQDAEAWAAGKRNGADVPSTDEAYHNNAKYFSEQANASAIESAGSADDAAQSAASISGLEDQIEQNTEDIANLLSAVGKMKIVPGLSGEAKDALLSCFEHLAWSDDQGLTLYNALFDALYPSTYTLDEPFVCDGVSDFIVTPVALLRKDRSYTILADFTEDVEFNESTNMYVCRLYDLRNGAEISLRDYRVSSANDRVRATWTVTSGRWVVGDRVATSGHRHIKAALSHVQGEHTFISAMSIDGVAATPDGISSLTYDPTLVTNVPLVIGATVGVDGVISRYFKGTIHGFQILDTAYTQSECDQYVLSTTV